MRGETKGRIDIIKQYYINFSIANRAIYNHGRERKVGGCELSSSLSCGRENHPCNVFVAHQVQVNGFLLRIFIGIAQEETVPLLIGGVFDGAADRGKEGVA